mgnify:CR=1 FL=1
MRPSLEQVIKHFFQSEERTLRLKGGDVLFLQGDTNDRLYYVVEGQLSATKEGGEDHMGYLLIQTGDFTGMHSFLAPSEGAAVTIVADTNTTLIHATATELSSRPEYTLEEVLIPIFANVMESRQKSIYKLMAREGQEKLSLEGKKKMDLLGQFSGGVAHELNNAIAVLEQGARWFPSPLSELVRKHDPLLYEVFRDGLNQRRLSSKELRDRAKEISEAHGLERNLARKCSHARLSDEMIKSLGHERLQDAYDIFEIGSVMNNMAIASEQAAAVVESMRNLGADNTGKGIEVKLDETIQRALTILRNITFGVDVIYESPERDVVIMGNKGEFVQVWTNLIRNGCDAMRSEKNPNPRIEVTLEMTSNGVKATISDNGPGIPEHAFRKIFQPNYSTKKTGLQFGLGIGLPIVKRIIESYGGSITVSNGGNLGGAVFEILLPFIGD